MRLKQTLALVWAMLTITGCRSRYTPPEGPMPPHTILLSHMMQQLSSRPGYPDALLAHLGGSRADAGKKGPALLTPDLLDELRKRILGRDWGGLDRFPGWTMREINPTIRLASRVVGKNAKLEALSAVRPGAPALADRQARIFLDLGPYALGQTQTVSLDQPSTLPPFTTKGIVTQVLPGLERGDGPSDLAPEHAASQRLADVLNRLSVNRLTGAGVFHAKVGGQSVTTPEALIAAIAAAGHTVTVTDSRYFANFGHLHFGGSDVMMPFWINTQIAVPHTGNLFLRSRPLLVPVSHAEFEWHIRGPKINADVSHYFGVDGKAEWRTMDTLDQRWVLKRNAHIYTGEQVLEVTRLVGLVTLAYMHQHARRPGLPFGGYYTLGVCQDTVSAVETRMTGRSTLFPNTADSSLFDDPRDAEINALFAAIPKDRAGAEPPPDRVFGSLPTLPGPHAAFAAVTIPGLPTDLQTTYLAWQQGHLSRVHGRLFYVLTDAALGTAALLSLALLLRWRMTYKRE